jgi:hypothetical protein
VIQEAPSCQSVHNIGRSDGAPSTYTGIWSNIAHSLLVTNTKVTTLAHANTQTDSLLTGETVPAIATDIKSNSAPYLIVSNPAATTIVSNTELTDSLVADGTAIEFAKYNEICSCNNADIFHQINLQNRMKLVASIMLSYSTKSIMSLCKNTHQLHLVKSAFTRTGIADHTDKCSSTKSGGRFT